TNPWQPAACREAPAVPWGGRSIAAGVDDLAAGHGAEGAPGAGVDTALDELDRPVEAGHVHAAGVVRLGGDQVAVLILVAVGGFGRGRVLVAPPAVLPVRGLDVAVAAPLAVARGQPAEAVVRVDADRGRRTAVGLADVLEVGPEAAEVGRGGRGRGDGG